MRNPAPILLVEDDDVDVENVVRAFEENAISNPLVVARHGEEALQYLHGDRPVVGMTEPLRPGLILLDLNMPIMNGIEFLFYLKNDPDFCSIPVVVLTTSQEESDRFESFKHSVAGYIIKPVEYSDFVRVISIIDQYWSLSESGS